MHALEGSFFESEGSVRHVRKKPSSLHPVCVCQLQQPPLGLYWLVQKLAQRGMVFTHGVWMSDRNCCLAYFTDSEKTHRIHTYTIWYRSPSTVKQHVACLCNFSFDLKLKKYFCIPHFFPGCAFHSRVVLSTSKALEAKHRFLTGNNTFDTFPSAWQATWQNCHCVV